MGSLVILWQVLHSEFTVSGFKEPPKLRWFLGMTIETQRGEVTCPRLLSHRQLEARLEFVFKTALFKKRSRGTKDIYSICPLIRSGEDGKRMPFHFLKEEPHVPRHLRGCHINYSFHLQEKTSKYYF